MKRKYLFTVFCLFIFQGCERRPEVYSYTEIHQQPAPALFAKPAPARLPPSMQAADAQTRKMLENSVSKVDLRWTLPEGWIEEPGQGIRLATLRSAGEHPVECSIVSLSGLAGGLAANISRWMGQIGVGAMDEAALEDFIRRLESVALKNGQAARVIDLTVFQAPDAKDSPSILGAVITMAEKSIFIKMSGTQAGITHHRENFINLLRSMDF